MNDYDLFYLFYVIFLNNNKLSKSFLLEKSLFYLFWLLINLKNFKCAASSYEKIYDNFN